MNRTLRTYLPRRWHQGKQPSRPLRQHIQHAARMGASCHGNEGEGEGESSKVSPVRVMHITGTEHIHIIQYRCIYKKTNP